MISMEIRKIVMADYDEGMKVESISRVARVSTFRSVTYSCSLSDFTSSGLLRKNPAHP